MTKLLHPIGLLFFVILLLGCSYKETYAPVVNGWNNPNSVKSRYRVQKDDTIYSIAWAFDLDYRDLAAANHLLPPYRLAPGQTLTMHSTAEQTKKNEIPTAPSVKVIAANDFKPIDNQAYEEVKEITLAVPERTFYPNAKPPTTITPSQVCLPELALSPLLSKAKLKQNVLEKTEPMFELPRRMAFNLPNSNATPSSLNHWCWPAKGKVAKEFCLEPGGNKGIDIAGELGDPIRAAAAGKVVYSGSGLKGYGNLIIIKHTDNYLSAYAYNKKLLVKEGDQVKAGAEIGKMGQNNCGNVMLHFEVRRNGKPVNPLLYL